MPKFPPRTPQQEADSLLDELLWLCLEDKKQLKSHLADYTKRYPNESEFWRWRKLVYDLSVEAGVW